MGTISKRDVSIRGHMRNINFTSALLFLAVIEEGSIAKAAKRENIVASAVSKRLADLEELFGVALVERGRRGVTPTPAGEALAHHARMIQQAIDRMQAEMVEYIEGVRGHIRVRASSSALSAGLTVDLQAFTRANRHVRIDLEEQETPVVFRDVAEGRADIGVAPYFTSQEGLQMFPYRGYDLCVVVPRGHELAGRKSITYAEALPYDQVDPGKTSALAQLLDSAARQFPVAKHTRIRVHGFDASCRMIASGLGIGVVPAFMEPSHGRIYDLVFVPLAEEWAHPEIRIVVRDLQALPSAAKTFVEHLRRSAQTRSGLTAG